MQPAHPATGEVDALQVAGQQFVRHSKPHGNRMQGLPRIGGVAVENWRCREAHALASPQLLDQPWLHPLDQRRPLSFEPRDRLILGDEGREARRDLRLLHDRVLHLVEAAHALHHRRQPAVAARLPRALGQKNVNHVLGGNAPRLQRAHCQRTPGVLVEKPIGDTPPHRIELHPLDDFVLAILATARFIEKIRLQHLQLHRYG